MGSFVPKWYGDVTEGKLVLHEREKFHSYLQSLTGKVEMIVYKWRSKRTDRQNRYYWAYLRMISEETGYQEDELHELFKQKFLDKRKIKVLNEEIEMHPSTTKLTRAEMAGYIVQISIFTGISAPDSKSVSVVD